MKKRGRLIWKIMKGINLDKIVYAFIILTLIFSFLFKLLEPNINTYFDGLWYSFSLITTIGFGDVYAVTPIGRVLSMFLGLYALIIVAIIPGIVVSYYVEVIGIQANETASKFLDKLERLPELSKDELKEISDTVKNRKYKK